MEKKREYRSVVISNFKEKAENSLTYTTKTYAEYINTINDPNNFKEDDIVIETAACGVGYLDYLVREGKFKDIFNTKNCTIGYEICGVIRKVGSFINKAQFSVGDFVAGILPISTRFGGYSDFCITKAHYVVNLSFLERLPPSNSIFNFISQEESDMAQELTPPPSQEAESPNADTISSSSPQITGLGDPVSPAIEKKSSGDSTSLLKPEIICGCLLPGVRALNSLFVKQTLSKNQIIYIHRGALDCNYIALQYSVFISHALVITSISSDEELNFIQDLLASSSESLLKIIDLRKENIYEEILKATGGVGVSCVLDCDGPKEINLSSHFSVILNSMSPNSNLITPNFEDFEFNLSTKRQISLKSIQISNVFEQTYLLAAHGMGHFLAMIKQILRDVFLGIIKVRINKVFTLESFREAHRFLKRVYSLPQQNSGDGVGGDAENNQPAISSQNVVTRCAKIVIKI